MMSVNDETTYWIKDKSWYKVTEDRKIALTPAAPKKAIESFKLWAKGQEHLVVLPESEEDSIIMSAKAEELYWRKNRAWYTFTEDRERFILTDKAPERAKESFKLWGKEFPHLVVLPESEE